MGEERKISEVKKTGSERLYGEESSEESMQTNASSSSVGDISSPSGLSNEERSAEEFGLPPRPTGRISSGDDSADEDIGNRAATGEARMVDVAEIEMDEPLALADESDDSDDELVMAYEDDEPEDLPRMIQENNPLLLFELDESLNEYIHYYEIIYWNEPCQCPVHQAGIPTYPNSCIPVLPIARPISPDAASVSR